MGNRSGVTVAGNNGGKRLSSSGGEVFQHRGGRTSLHAEGVRLSRESRSSKTDCGRGRNEVRNAMECTT